MILTGFISRPRCIARFAAFLLFMPFLHEARAADWPAYRSDIARSGTTDEDLAADLSLRWTYEPISVPRPAWPDPSEELPRNHADSAYHVAVADGTVYFGSSVTNKVHAIDAETGSVRWTYFTEGPVRFAPTFSDGRLYFGSDDGYVYCLDASDGTLEWKIRAGPSGEQVIGNGRIISLWPVRTNVLVDAGVAYFTAGVFPYEGIYVGALNVEDGSEIWKNDTVGDRAHELEYGGISPHGYLLASPEILYVPSGRSMPCAFDRKTGKFLFATSPGGKRGGAWALLDKNRLIAGVDQSGKPEKSLYDAKSGKRLGDAFAWFPGVDMTIAAEIVTIVTKEGIHAIDGPAYTQAVGKQSKLFAQQQEVGRQLAGLKKRRANASEQAAGDKPQGDLAQGDLDGQIGQMQQKIGRLTAERAKVKQSATLWRYPEKGFTSVIRAGNSLFAGGHERVVRLDRTTGDLLWQHAVEGRAVGLAVADGHLIVSTHLGHIYTFGTNVTQTDLIVRTSLDDEPYPRDGLSETYRKAARTILDDTGITKGYCVVLDCGEGRLAYELARQSDLKIVGIESEPERRTVARSRLEAAGLLGTRVVVEPWRLETLPEWFANLIVSDGLLVTGKTDSDAPGRLRLLRPWGGVELLGSLEGEEIAWKKSLRGPLEGAGTWTQQYGDPHNTACSGDQLVHGPLGIQWFGEPGPQGMVERHACAESPVAMNGRLFIEGEERIMAVDAFNGTLLWSREIPGAVRVKIKADSGNLVVTDSGLFVAAHDRCFQLDPATGQTKKVYEIPGAEPETPRRWGYLSVVDHVLYGSAAKSMDREYGELLKTFLANGRWRDAEQIPAKYVSDYQRLKRQYPDPHELRMAAERSGMLYYRMTSFASGGEFTQKHAVTDHLMVCDKVFAIDTDSDEVLWVHKGKKIANITLVLGDGKIFFAESGVSHEMRSEALASRKRAISEGVYQQREGILDELKENERRRAEHVAQKGSIDPSDANRIRQINWRIFEDDYLIESLKAELYQEEVAEGSLTFQESDIRMATALNARTGEILWEKPVDLTGCCGDKMGAATSDGLLLFFGNHGNHDAWRFRLGGMKWRRITVLSSETGDMVWSRPLNYRTRPVLVGDKVILEPRACDLHTGETVMRTHPVTGLQTPWEFLRPGHTCGLTAASADGLFYRSACTAFYDLTPDRGVTIFGGYRPGCAISVIPACGLLLSPEAAAGCTCSYPIRCSVVLKHKPNRQQPWTVYVTPGAMRPVRHLAINFGASADMKDEEGTVWFGYPSPKTDRHTHFPNYGVKLDLNDQILPRMGYFNRDHKGRSIAGCDRPWLFTSGCLGLVRCELPLIDLNAEGQEETAGQGVRYTVRLGFNVPDGDQSGQRIFDVRLQGKTVEKGLDIAGLTGGEDRAIVRVYEGVVVKENLLLEMVASGAAPDAAPRPAEAPLINFIEVLRASPDSGRH